MHDRLKETLSALKDGHADELELRRLLNEMDNDPSLQQTWARYEMIGAVMREEAVNTVDLSRGIRQAIDGEPMDDVPARSLPQTETAPEAGAQGWQHWLTGGAVAAAVTLAVLLGVRLDSEQQPLVAENAVPVSQPESIAPSGPSVVADAPASPAELQVASQLQAELPEAQRKLQQYVLQHTEHAALNTGRGMMPFARVASFGEPEQAPKSSGASPQ